VPWWDPSPIWKGDDAYIIGGGDSLHRFDWDLIKGENTIGCNGAYRHGAHICRIVMFGDILWWDKIGRHKLPEYGGMVVSVCRKLKPGPDQNWVLRLKHHDRRELATSGAITWYGNTGAAALHLALILGARRVFLLGFDMKLGGSQDPTRRDKANYHDERYEDSKAEVYPRFMRQFADLESSRKVMFPDREIWNVSDVSELNVFPKIGLRDHFEGKREGSKWKSKESAA